MKVSKSFSHVMNTWPHVALLLQELLSLDHGRPIEDVAFFPSGQSPHIKLSGQPLQPAGPPGHAAWVNPDRSHIF